MTTPGVDRETLDLATLSDDAKAIAGCWFAKMKVDGESALTLHMVENVPAPRTEAALAELVERGVVSVAPFNRFGGLVYKPLIDCHPAFRWFMENAKRPDINFRLMVPAKASSEGGR